MLGNNYTVYEEFSILYAVPEESSNVVNDMVIFLLTIGFLTVMLMIENCTLLELQTPVTMDVLLVVVTVDSEEPDEIDRDLSYVILTLDDWLQYIDR